ncbi:MAG: HD-GYP domain-containing protein, partial [Candidatus Omnitrophota bacterium]
SEEDVETLRYASPMHDIGKIAIPDAILKKPGKLTPEEWEVMKQHTVIGSKIFQNSRSSILRAAAQIALTHHEKYDGSGYPRGLKGEDIPIFGRITAVVDVFDAVLSKRCYKAASTFDEAFSYIESLAGTHLDPKLVEAFVRIKKKIISIYEANTVIQHFVNDFGTL